MGQCEREGGDQDDRHHGQPAGPPARNKCPQRGQGEPHPPRRVPLSGQIERDGGGTPGVEEGEGSRDDVEAAGASPGEESVEDRAVRSGEEPDDRAGHLRRLQQLSEGDEVERRQQCADRQEDRTRLPHPLPAAKEQAATDERRGVGTKDDEAPPGGQLLALATHEDQGGDHKQEGPDV